MLSQKHTQNIDLDGNTTEKGLPNVQRDVIPAMMKVTKRRRQKDLFVGVSFERWRFARETEEQDGDVNRCKCKSEQREVCKVNEGKQRQERWG